MSRRRGFSIRRAVANWLWEGLDSRSEPLARKKTRCDPCQIPLVVISELAHISCAAPPAYPALDSSYMHHPPGGRPGGARLSSICSWLWGGVPGGGAEVGVPEPCGDGVHGHAASRQWVAPVGAQPVRVRAARARRRPRAAAAHEPVHADGGEGERFFVSVTAEPHEQRLLVEQPDAAGRGRWTFSHASSACCTAWGTGTSRSRPPLPAHEQAVVPRVGTRGADLARGGLGSTPSRA
jgi:hypothetical protein